MFPSNQGPRMQISDTEADKPCLGRANLAHMRCILVRSGRTLRTGRRLEDMPPGWVHVEETNRRPT